MKAEVLQFLRRDIEIYSPHYQALGAHPDKQFVGTIFVKRADDQLLYVDLYVGRPDVGRKWDPLLKIVWGAGSYVSDTATILGLSASIDTTTNQYAFFFLRDHLKENWWSVVSRTPYCP